MKADAIFESAYREQRDQYRQQIDELQQPFNLKWRANELDLLIELEPDHPALDDRLAERRRIAAELDETP